MIRGGAPQSFAKKVTGHLSDSMFDRYTITSLDDQRVALERAQSHAESRTAFGENVAPFRPNEHTDEHTSPEVWRKAPPIGVDLVGMPGFEPGTP